MSLFARLAVLLALLPLPAVAQNTEAFYDNYLALRARLDTLVKNRDIAEVMPAFGDQSNPDELEALELRVREIYPRDFENVALIRRQDMDHGFRQELIAFWVGGQYMYVYMLLHDRDDGIMALGFNFNSDFDELNGKF